jgi:hypothetical protein
MTLMKKTAFVITVVISEKINYVSETIKLFSGQLTPGYNKDVNEAIIFESRSQAEAIVSNIRDFHNRKFMIDSIETTSEKTLKAYTRTQNQIEFN